MKIVIQRVSSAELSSGAQPITIARGMLALVGIEQGDDQRTVERMRERLLNFRIFPDLQGRMNLNIRDIDGDLLIVPNFTVAADTRKGTRASFSSAAAPADAERLFHALKLTLCERHPATAAGIFAADMQITLTNDGPVTFILQS